MEGADGVLFASGRVWGDRLFSSSDAGSTWSEINLPIDDAEVTVSQFPYLGKTSDGELWAGGWAHGVQDILVHSSDNGATWDTTASIVHGDIATAIIFDMVEDASGTLFIGHHPGPDSVVTRSPDGGETWITAGHLPGAFEALCLLRTSDGAILAGTTPDGEVFRRRPHAVENDGRKVR